MVCYNCGSKDHWYRECPHPKRSNYPQQHQEPGSPQRQVPRSAVRGAPKALPSRKGDKGGKGKGQKGKDDAKNQNPKGQGKRQGRPGARQALDGEPEHPEDPDDDYGCGEYPPEDPENEQENPEGTTGEDSYNYGWNEQQDPDEQQPPDDNESIVKTVVAAMQRLAEEEKMKNRKR